MAFTRCCCELAVFCSSDWRHIDPSACGLLHCRSSGYTLSVGDVRCLMRFVESGDMQENGPESAKEL